MDMYILSGIFHYSTSSFNLIIMMPTYDITYGNIHFHTILY